MSGSNILTDIQLERLSRLEMTHFNLHDEFGSKTTYRVGGKCALFVSCGSTSSLSELLQIIDDLPIYVLGNGSNTLVSESGWPGVVVKLNGDFDSIAINGTEVTLGGGVSLPTAARRIATAGLGGFEWAVGIPGTVGGAVKMNAGGHGSETKEWITSVGMFKSSNGRFQFANHLVTELNLRYRGSNISDNDIVVFAKLELEPEDPQRSKDLISEIVAWRRENQPGGQNAGSVFTNPRDDHAARLIEHIGLKGFRLRSANISQRHANFIQSESGGSSDDVFELIWLTQQKVESELGVRLKTEIKLVGFDEERSTYLRGE